MKLPLSLYDNKLSWFNLSNFGVNLFKAHNIHIITFITDHS